MLNIDKELTSFATKLDDMIQLCDLAISLSAIISVMEKITAKDKLDSFYFIPEVEKDKLIMANQAMYETALRGLGLPLNSTWVQVFNHLTVLKNLRDQLQLVRKDVDSFKK